MWLVVHEAVSALSVCLPLIWLLPFHIIVYKITTFAHQYSWRVFSKQHLEAFNFENTQTRIFQTRKFYPNQEISECPEHLFSPSGFKQWFNYDDHIFCWQVAPSVEFIQSEGWCSFICLGLGQPLVWISTSEFVWFPLCCWPPTWCCAGLLILQELGKCCFSPSQVFCCALWTKDFMFHIQHREARAWLGAATETFHLTSST